MKKIKILIPVYNDWKSVFKLLESIDLQIIEWDAEVSVLIVNDASTEKKPTNAISLKNIKSVQIINMKENKGHARCNAAGLKYISEKEDFDYVVPMDGDGEDRPEELNLLFNKSKEYPDKVITADRVKRVEGPLFKFCYLMHKYLTFIFAGQSIKFGNYTCLPKLIVNGMTQSSSTWSSFSGSLAKLVKDRTSIPSIRGSRYFGPSQMSFFNLLKHSLSIIAVFKKTVIIRSIIFLLVYLFFTYQSLSIITVIPVFLVLILIFSVISLSKRENLEELNNSLNNIQDIETLK
jgi:glycosyltransferase involved in cell wall biosynthesis